MNDVLKGRELERKALIRYCKRRITDIQDNWPGHDTSYYREIVEWAEKRQKELREMCP